MTPVTSSNLLVTDPSSLKDLDRLVTIARTMMDGMLQNPETLAGFTGHTLPENSARYKGGDQGVSTTFDFSKHQSLDVALSLVTQYDSNQKWVLSFRGLPVLTKQMGLRTYEPSSVEFAHGKPMTPIDGLWKSNDAAISEHAVPKLMRMVRMVVENSLDLEETLSNPIYLSEARREKCARNGLRFIESLQAPVFKKHEMGDANMSVADNILTVNLSQKAFRP